MLLTPPEEAAALKLLNIALPGLTGDPGELMQLHRLHRRLVERASTRAQIHSTILKQGQPA